MSLQMHKFSYRCFPSIDRRGLIEHDAWQCIASLRSPFFIDDERMHDRCSYEGLVVGEIEHSLNIPVKFH